MQKVVFLDRDGTLNTEVNYLYRKEDLELIPGTAEALKLLHEAGYKLIVLTNQAGVARGYYTEADVHALHEDFNEVLGAEGAHIDAFYYCPHHPEHGIGEYKKICHCRKPETGLFEMAEKDLAEAVDKEHSFMIGDKLGDTEAGHNYGIRSILVGSGYGASIRAGEIAAGEVLPDGRPASGAYDYYAETLLDAAKMIAGQADRN